MGKSLFDPAAPTATHMQAAQLQTAPPGGILSQTLLAQPGGKVMVFSLDAGEALTEHTNPNHAILLPTHGRLIVTAGGEQFELAPGDTLHFPPQLPHAVQAPEPAGFVLTLLQPQSPK